MIVIDDLNARMAADPNSGVLLWTGLGEALAQDPHAFENSELIADLATWCRQDSITQMAMEWVCQWVMCGRPQIEVGEKLAASLMLTRVPAEVASATPLPYPAFLVRIPDGLLVTQGAVVRSGGRQEVPADLSMAMVMRRRNDQLVVVFASRKSPTLWMQVSEDFGDVFSPGTDLELPASWEGLVLENTRQDKRAVQLGLQLVFGTVLELLARTAPPRPGVAKVGQVSSRKKKESLVPKPLTIRVVREVSLDMRPAVRDYVAHGTSAPTVRTLVRGHWKNQPVGPQRQERKLIQVEPYWRGPEEGPVVVRPIRME